MLNLLPRPKDKAEGGDTNGHNHDKTNYIVRNINTTVFSLLRSSSESHNSFLSLGQRTRTCGLTLRPPGVRMYTGTGGTADCVGWHCHVPALHRLPPSTPRDRIQDLPLGGPVEVWGKAHHWGCGPGSSNLGEGLACFPPAETAITRYTCRPKAGMSVVTNREGAASLHSRQLD